MHLPTVTEHPLRLEPVVPDPFIAAIGVGDPPVKSLGAAAAVAIRTKASIAGAQPPRAHDGRRRRLVADRHASVAWVPASAGFCTRPVTRGPGSCEMAGKFGASPQEPELLHVLALP